MGFFKQLSTNWKNSNANISVIISINDDIIWHTKTDGLTLHRGYQSVRNFMMKGIKGLPVGKITEEDIKYDFWFSALQGVISSINNAEFASTNTGVSVINSGLFFLVECGFQEFETGDTMWCNLKANGDVTIQRSSDNIDRIGEKILGNAFDMQDLQDKIRHPFLGITP